MTLITEICIQQHKHTYALFTAHAEFIQFCMLKRVTFCLQSLCVGKIGQDSISFCAQQLLWSLDQV